MALVDQNDIAQFKDAYLEVMEVMESDAHFRQLPREFQKSLRECMDYNLSAGKCIRGYLLIATFKHMVPEASAQELQKACILAWAVEMYQAFALMQDDIMDGSETRRGKLCWYRQAHVGTKALNDANVLLFLTDKVIARFFGDTRFYADIIRLVDEIKWVSSLGQHLDLRMSEFYSPELFTLDHYKLLIEKKTSTYTFYFPIALGLILADVDTTGGAEDSLRELCSALGYYFSVQDDFLDVFGDPEVTGKIGTDIEDGKCTWVVVTALKNAGNDQVREVIKNKLGSRNGEDVAEVKRAMEEAGVVETFKEFERESLGSMERLLRALPKKLPVEVFYKIFSKLQNREK